MTFIGLEVILRVLNAILRYIFLIMDKLNLESALLKTMYETQALFSF